MGKQKVGLLGLEFGGWLGGNLSGVVIQVVGSSWAKKNDYSETEKRWYGVVLLFVRMYYHLVNDVSLCAVWVFVIYLVENLGCFGKKFVWMFGGFG